MFEKYVKYANETTYDVIYSTQYYMRYINRAMLAGLHHRPLKLGRLIGNTRMTIKIMFPWQLTLFQSPPTLFQSVGDFQHKKTLNGATNSS